MIGDESQKAKCVIIGEDLGTIPDGLRSAMESVNLMGCGIVIIERDAEGRILPLGNARELSLTAFSNHDFPTLTGFWEGQDFASAKLHAALADCPALLVAVQLEDLLLQREQPNVPGTTDEQPNWRRKYSASIEDMNNLSSTELITTALRAARPTQ